MLQGQALELMTPPTSEPITLTQAKAHLRVDHTDDDTLITRMIEAARLDIEARTMRALCDQTWRYTFDRFPRFNRIIKIPRPPLIAITAFTYVDGDGATQNMTGYQLDQRSSPARVRPAADGTWPEVKEDTINTVTLTFRAGYDDQGSPSEAGTYVPESIKSAILLSLGAMYAHREEVSAVLAVKPPVLPKSVDHLLAPYVVQDFRF